MQGHRHELRTGGPPTSSHKCTRPSVLFCLLQLMFVGSKRTTVERILRALGFQAGDTRSKCANIVPITLR